MPPNFFPVIGDTVCNDLKVKEVCVILPCYYYIPKK